MPTHNICTIFLYSFNNFSLIYIAKQITARNIAIDKRKLEDNNIYLHVKLENSYKHHVRTCIIS